jgi:predicted RNase H-like HicB family nuclease
MSTIEQGDVVDLSSFRLQCKAHALEDRTPPMNVVKIVYWKGEKFWLGYLQDYPDYWAQGKTLRELREHLQDLYRDLTSGEIPAIRKVEELVIP